MEGGIKLKGEKIYSLSYADDVMLLAEEEDEMRSMLGRLEEYLDKKGLELNVGKIKVLRCRKGVGKWKKRI